jgi:hypothetical protein
MNGAEEPVCYAELGERGSLPAWSYAQWVLNWLENILTK